MRGQQGNQLLLIQLVRVARSFGDGEQPVVFKQAGKFAQIRAALGNFAEDADQHDAVETVVRKVEAAAVAQLASGVCDVAFFQTATGDGKHFGLNVRQDQFTLRHGTRQCGAKVAGAAAHFQDTAVGGGVQPPQQFRRRQEQRPQRDKQGERHLVRKQRARLGQPPDDVFEAGSCHAGYSRGA